MKRRGRPPHPDILTPREWEVLALLREGLSNEQIAERLDVTPRAARYHVSEILSKLQVATREEAAAWQPPAPGRGRWLAAAQVAAAIAALGVLTGLGVLGWSVASGGSMAEPTPVPTLSAPAAPGGPDWTALEGHPLTPPATPANGECPTASGHVVSSEFAPALGDGPVYPVGLSTDGVLLVGAFPVGGDWLGMKVLWVAPSDFSGKALVRGYRLDAPGQVGFAGGLTPVSELRLESSHYANQPPGGVWDNWPSYTRVPGPGCYAYQVDTPSLSYTIVFRAELAPS